MRLQDKVAIITGGTQGIGKGIAAAFLAEGANVVISGRSADKGAAALADLGAPDRSMFVAGDVTSQANVEALIDATIARFASVHILVNNAGGSSGFALVEDLSDEAWQQALNWCLNSTFWATRRVLKPMVAQGFGRIINISSVEGKLGNKASVSHYITNKHAINGFTKAVAFEYGTKGITSNAICPGAIETALMMEVGPKYAEGLGMTYDEYKATYAKESMINRLNTVEEVAAMAVLLASDAGAGITGSLLNVDGGTAPW
jgi:3-hydroxybutyrate dehydrogenase/3-oxoacyl-[acyl-carrier protein] reductase